MASKKNSSMDKKNSRLDKKKRRVARRYDRWSRYYDLFDLGGQGKQKMSGVELLSLSPGLELLDIGTGTGAILDVLAPRISPGRVVAIDISPGMIKRVAERFKDLKNVEAKVDDVESLSFKNNSFDRVFATFAFTSFPNPEISMKETARVMKLGAVMVVVDTGRPVTRTGWLAYAFLRPAMYLAGYTRINTDVHKLAEKAGLKHVSTEHFKFSLVYCAVFKK